MLLQRGKGNWEDYAVNTLEKGKAIHSNILAWRIPWTVLVHGVTKSQTQVSDFDFHAVNKELVAFRGLNCCGEEEPAFLLCCAPLCSTLCSPPGSSLSSFKSSKMMLWKCCAQNGPGNLENSAVARGLEKVSFHSNPKKGNTKECSNYHPIALISHASKEMLKILQARLQQYMDCELPDVQVGFSKGRGTRDQIANITWIIKKATEFQKNIYFCFIDYAKAFDCVNNNKLWKIVLFFFHLFLLFGGVFFCLFLLFGGFFSFIFIIWKCFFSIYLYYLEGFFRLFLLFGGFFFFIYFYYLKAKENS